MRRLLCALCLAAVVCYAGSMASACPPVAVGGCVATCAGVGVATGFSGVVANQVFAVPSVVATFAVPTVVSTPVVVQQTVVRQRAVRVRSRSVSRSRSSVGLGIF